ncbi:MAG: RNA polymerase sigma-70 factor [Bacteroidales bacterium]|jgi:RNA polymerase sigma-70 factor (ECF subfamily)|nr:RNA polymerase sigma-70 factor [Bacteroidales bacterium]MCI2145876.1 RNA polymerase sigma-70 factor [Bacteroidales bacterium]
MDIENKQDEKTLLRRLRKGDSESFLELYDKYAGRIYNFISSILADKSLAEDMTQDCFMKVWEKRENIDPEGRFVAYIYTIARHFVYKETRKRLLGERFLSYEKANSNSAEDTTTNEMNRKYIEERIGKIIGGFPEAMKRIYLMNTREGKKPSQIAEELGISVKTVDTQLYRARKALRKGIDDFLCFLLFFI